MKIMLLALLFPVFCHAQNEKTTNLALVFQDSIPKTSFFLKDRRIVFQKVYPSNLTQKELSDKVYTMLNTTKGFKFSLDGISDIDFYGELCQYRFDVERYGVTLFNAPIVLNVPIDAKVIIQVKDYKYRITISEVAFRYYGPNPENNVDELLEKSLIERDGKKIKTSKSNTKLTNYLDQDFSALFDLGKSLTAGDF